MNTGDSRTDLKFSCLGNLSGYFQIFQRKIKCQLGQQRKIKQVWNKSDNNFESPADSKKISHFAAYIYFDVRGF